MQLTRPLSITDESGQVLSKPKRKNAPTLRLKRNNLLTRSVTLSLAASQYNQLKDNLVPIELADCKETTLKLSAPQSLTPGAVESVANYKCVRSNLVFSTADIPREVCICIWSNFSP